MSLLPASIGTQNGVTANAPKPLAAIDAANGSKLEKFLDEFLFLHGVTV